MPKRPTTPQKPPRTIIVRFVGNATKRLFLKLRSKLKDLRRPNAPRIYVNEDLTRTRAVLASKARALVSEKKAESSWVTQGVVLIKLKDGSVTKVANPTHFEEVVESTRLIMKINLSQDAQTPSEN